MKSGRRGKFGWRVSQSAVSLSHASHVLWLRRVGSSTAQVARGVFRLTTDSHILSLRTTSSIITHAHYHRYPLITLLPLHLHFHKTPHPPKTELTPVNKINGP